MDAPASASELGVWLQSVNPRERAVWVTDPALAGVLSPISHPSRVMLGTRDTEA